MNAFSTFSEHTITIDLDYDSIESTAQADQLCDEMDGALTDWKKAVYQLLENHNLVGHVAISLSR